MCPKQVAHKNVVPTGTATQVSTCDIEHAGPYRDSMAAITAGTIKKST